MAKLRHVALIVEDPEVAAKFFEQAFDMKRAGTARRGIYMSDGIINVALLEEGKREGAHRHLSFRHVGRRPRRSREEGRGCGRRISGRASDLAEFVLRSEISRAERLRIRPHAQRLGRRGQGSGRESSGGAGRMAASKPVVVVGAGPVGLCLALALAQSEIAVALIESMSDENFLDQVPRAGSNHPSTLEFFDRIGLYATHAAARHRCAEIPVLGPARRQRDRRIRPHPSEKRHQVSVRPAMRAHQDHRRGARHGEAASADCGADGDDLYRLQPGRRWRARSMSPIATAMPKPISAATSPAPKARAASRARTMNVEFEGFTYPERTLNIEVAYDFTKHGFTERNYISDPRRIFQSVSLERTAGSLAHPFSDRSERRRSEAHARRRDAGASEELSAERRATTKFAAGTSTPFISALRRPFASAA